MILDSKPIIFILVLAIIPTIIIYLSFYVQKEQDREQDKINNMNPEEREKYKLSKKQEAEELQRRNKQEAHEKALQNAFGCTNPQLICPHCQTKGTVRAKGAERLLSTTGKIGGILKTNTKSTTKQYVTQHHCDNCGSTWDI